MLYFANDDMFVNKFVEVILPTKHQIFARTGQRAVSPAGSYTGDEEVHFKNTPTSGLERFSRDAEAFESPSETKESKESKSK